MTNFIFFLLIPTGGVLLEIAVTTFLDRRNRVVTWSVWRYLFAVSLIVLATVTMVQRLGVEIVAIFASGIVLGTVAEWFTAWSYLHIEHEHFWRYFKGTKEGHTSFLVIPVWGYAGVLFFLSGNVVLELLS